MSECHYVANCMCGRNEVLVPGRHFWGNFVLDQLPQLGDSRNAKVYWADDKVGRGFVMQCI